MQAKMNSTNVIGIKILILNIILQVGQTQRSGGGGGSGVAFPFPPPPPLVFKDERLAAVFPTIQKFKSTITSDPLNVTATWLGGDVCSYRGFYCDAPPDNQSATAVASVDFNGFRLAAPTLAGFLDQLPDLALFHANSNSFAGAIPPAIAALPYLYELDISNNRFSGPFPAAILAMERLTLLDIRFNSFSGSVPPELFTRSDLNALFVNDNNFMMRLPEDIGGSHILYLTLANNKLFGPIPRGISRALADISEILLANNLLSGCLPYEIGLLNRAVVFDAGNNRLTGRLPWSFGCLENVEVLNLAGNLLYGNVPEVVCALGKVANLSLSDNYFTHVGPVCWGLIESGVLDVRNNCIPGLGLQRSVPECAAFFAHPRFCPYWPTSFAYMPCRVSHFGPATSDSPEWAPAPS